MKYSFRKHAAIASAICALLFTGTACEESNPEQEKIKAELSVNPKSITLEAGGEAQTISISTNGTISYTGNPSWLDVTADGNTLIVEAQPNTGNEPRHATITITASTEDDSAEEKVNVTQLSESAVPSDVVVFGDPSFEEYILGYYDSNRDGLLQKSEAELIIELSLYDETMQESIPFQSLKGIESFVNLTSLECDCCGIEASIDVSGLQKLKYLICNDNNISELRFANCPSLTSIICADNNIRQLDLKAAGCTGLQWLDCERNQLTSLDCSGLAALQHLYCSGNNISDLKTDNLTALTTLICFKNPIGKLNFQDMPELEYVICSDNSLSEINLDGMSKLQSLDCSNNAISSLDVTDTPLLIALNCKGNFITELKGLGGLENIITLYCSDNSISSLDLTGKKSLTEVDCSINTLESLELDGCQAITSLLCNSCGLKELDVTGQPALETLECEHNKLTSIDVSENTMLSKLWARGNKLTELLISAGQSISDLKVDDRSVIKYKGSQPGADADIHDYTETF